MDKDEVFGKEMEVIPDFTFSNGVAAVFDDMLDRSVPFYQEMQRMISEMAADFAVEGSNVYDLGCSTGTTLVNLHQSIPAGVKLIGIDNSEPMLEKCRLKLESIGQARDFELLCTDLNQGIHIENASLVCMVLTLQFIRPLYRNKLIESIFRGMNDAYGYGRSFSGFQPEGAACGQGSLWLGKLLCLRQLRFRCTCGGAVASFHSLPCM